ncbi:MAG: tetratricopeptide repeat protein [Bacteroidales bacterium]|nr:tetratricopeptide repeat protein [Bacteroidales bacterium]
MQNKFIRWTAFISVILFVIILSTRQLSDPDIGFHLKYGQWIVENAQVPTVDQSTYTVSENRYIDPHWAFQVFIYACYRVLGYEGLSLLLIVCGLFLAIITLIRYRNFNLPELFSIVLLLFFFLIIESRLILRPEIFSFLFLSLILLILEQYYHRGKKRLFFLPLIMLVWVQVHSLFILGLAGICIFFISLWWKNKKPDWSLFLWMFIAFAVCFLNPYHINGVFFPFSLLSRFNSSNIYHQHIAEFKSFFAIDKHTAVEMLFLVFLASTFILYMLTYRKRRLHEWLLLLLSTYLSLVVVRNIPFFAIMNFPVLGDSLRDLESIYFSKKQPVKWMSYRSGTLVFSVGLIVIFMSGSGIFRVLNGSFYESDHTNNKAGIGINKFQLPENASEFLIKNKLNGKLLNSLGIGGWLSWKLSQPVFIDGRLEVMNESLYLELMDSWNNKLGKLINKYQPRLIVYNYLKYYPWTHQLYQMPDWKLIYLDGLFVVWAEKEYARDIPELIPSTFLGAFRFQQINPERIASRNSARRAFPDWLSDGRDDSTDFFRNIGMFFLQGGDILSAGICLDEVMTRTDGKDIIATQALSEIKQGRKDKKQVEKAEEKGTQLNRNAAMQYFNRGNDLYRQKDLQGAIDSYTLAINLDPFYSKALNNRGNIYALLGNYKIAKRDFDSALTIDPAFADAYLGRGTCKYSLGDRKGALRDWLMAEKLGNLNARRMINLYTK